MSCIWVGEIPAQRGAKNGRIVWKDTIRPIFTPDFMQSAASHPFPRGHSVHRIIPFSARAYNPSHHSLLFRDTRSVGLSRRAGRWGRDKRSTPVWLLNKRAPSKGRSSDKASRKGVGGAALNTGSSKHGQLATHLMRRRWRPRPPARARRRTGPRGGPRSRAPARGRARS